MTSWRGVAIGALAVVFAIAVGIILGSGPLRTALTGQTAAQADALRGELADRDAQLIAKDQLLAANQELIAALVPVAAHDRLAGETAVVLVGPGVDASAVEATTAALEAAGADVSATATLAPSWLSAEHVAFRAALAQQIIADVGVADATASPEQVLSGALVQALVPSAAVAAGPAPDPGEAPLDAAIAAQRSAVLRDVLTRAELVTIAEAQTPSDPASPAPEPTIAVILVGDETDAAARATSAQQLVRLAAAFGQAGLGTVLASGTPQSDDVGAAVAADREASGGASVVANAWSDVGPLVIVLAAQEQRAGGAGIYGSSERGTLLPSP